MPLDLVLCRFILLGMLLALAVLMLFHSWPYDDYSNEFVPTAGWWIALHTVAFVLLAFTVAVVWLLTDGLKGADVFISRLGAVVFAIFYNIGDAVAGVGTGILACTTADTRLGERDTSGESIETLFVDLIKALSFEIGFYAWLVALFAAAVALYRAGVPRSSLLLFATAAYFLTDDHAVPFGSLAFGSFFLGVLWLELVWRAPARAESLLVRSIVSDLR